MYDIKELFQADSIEAAVALLQAHPEAVILSGGSDILIKIRDGKLSGCSLVSIHNIPELKGVSLTEDGDIRIQSATSFSHISQDPLIRKYVPVLGEAVEQVGGPQIRNIGTIGGNISNGVTSADSASTLFCWNAELELAGPGPNGTLSIRTLPISEYYLSAGKVDLRPGELLRSILIRKESYEGYFGHYIKYAMRNAMDIATLGCSASCRLNADHTVLEDARLAFGVAGPTPVRCPKAEAAVRGQALSDGLFRTLARTAVEEVNPRSSWRASKEFRLHLVEELSCRAMKEAAKKAGYQEEN